MPDDKQFDVEGARKAGYSDDDIIQHLSQSRKFDVAGAQKAGYSSQEIIDHLSGVAPTATQTVSTPVPEQPNSFFGGLGRRALDTAKGIYETVKPPETPAEKTAAVIGGPGGAAMYRMGKGIIEGYKQKGTEFATNLASGQFGKAALNTLQMAPGSPIGPATPTGSLVDTAMQGRYREALGGAAFDALTLLAPKMLRPLSMETRVGKLTAAVGKTGETADILKKVLPDIDNVVQQVGAKPETIGDLRHATQVAIDSHEAPFNQALAGVRNQLVDTGAVRQRILGLIKADSPPEEIAAIKKAANEYLQPKTMEWLDARRGRLNASTSPVWDKSSRAVATQMKSDLDMAIDRTARNAVADLEYNVMDRNYPGSNFSQSKSQVSSLWKLKDTLDDQIGKLTDEQYYKKGKGVLGALKPSAYASKTGIHGYIGGVTSAFAPGPLSEASGYVKKAFGTAGPGKAAAAAAILSAPLERLTTTSDEQRPGGMTPPPQP